ncbi:MAG: hypothetical protein MUF01_00125 [Bryobacterales bacterium]|jgi:hypothetical protein|nr:hypothetical protein [Bryobacterales bacterium]
MMATTVALLMGLVLPLHAHFVFVSLQPGGKEARVVMSEDVKPDLDVKMIASTKLQLLRADGTVQALDMTQPEKNFFAVALSGQGDRVVFGKTPFGVMQRGESKPHLLVYYPKMVAGNPFAPSTSLSGRAPVELLAVGDASGIRFKLMANGRPLPDSEVVVLLPDGSESKVKTDAQGETEGEFREPGQYAVWARYWEDVKGEHDGKSYEQIRHYATLVVDTKTAPMVTENAAPAPVVARMPVAAASFGAVAANGWLYVYGGHTAPTHVYHKESVSGGFHRMRMQGDAQWEALPGGPGLQGLNLAADATSIYRVGGMFPANDKGKPVDHQSVADAARFDLKSGEWKTLPSLPQPLSSHDTVVLGDTLYLVGGWRLMGKEESWSEQMLTLDLRNPEAGWQMHPQPFQRRALMAAAFQGKIWVVGGIAKNGKVSRSVDIYDPATKSWSNGPELPEGQFLGFSPAVGVHQGALLAAVADGSVLRLTASGDGWETVGEVLPRVAHRLVSSGDKVLVLGGANKGKNLDVVEAITVAAR